MDTNYDLIKTIDDDQEVPDFSDKSDEEEDFQPRRPKKKEEKERKDFDNDFQFINSTSEYNQDTWNDLSKYIKRIAKTKLDDKIKIARRDRQNGIEEIEIDPELKEVKGDDGVYLSDEDLKKDDFKTRQKKGKKFEKKKDAELMDFEECSAYDTSTTFQQMNLSRPLMKVCILFLIVIIHSY
ncbi:probable ATP-dependent RNA helicase DDX27 [Belonocnema kinseyi]|uniref:probable ATP-dependent RNA helicase DDX27 n=1 Tax=Belonocnema kinseyi TaxID=2817044 RepID=UPI00143D2F84|nr:probable ATP-dependent RNA helicase DDX27 [Belonocnema kinseyi]